MYEYCKNKYFLNKTRARLRVIIKVKLCSFFFAKSRYIIVLSETVNFSNWIVCKDYMEVETNIQNYETSTVSKFAIWYTEKDFGKIGNIYLNILNIVD